MRKIIPGLVLLMVINGASAMEGKNWKKEKGMTPYKLVSSGYKLVSTSHSITSNKHSEYLYFQKENSLYRCLSVTAGSGTSKVRCGVLVEPGRK